MLQTLKKQLIKSLNTQYTLSEATTITHQVFEYVLGSKPIFFSQEPLTETQLQIYEHIKNRLLNGEPLQYILQRAYFFDFTLFVNEHVLIPRPETEEIVEWTIRYLQKNTQSIKKVLDIGTGSGCIAIALKKKLSQLNVSAWEISPNALEVAIHNAESQQVTVHFYQQDIFSSSIEEAFLPFDCIISNPPYIPWSEKIQLHKNVVEYEPHLALFVPDNNPLLFYEAIALRAKNAHKPIITEVHQNYAHQVKKLYLNIGLKEVKLCKDMSGNDRWITANLIY